MLKSIDYLVWGNFLLQFWKSIHLSRSNKFYDFNIYRVNTICKSHSLLTVITVITVLNGYQEKMHHQEYLAIPVIIRIRLNILLTYRRIEMVICLTHKKLNYVCTREQALKESERARKREAMPMIWTVPMFSLASIFLKKTKKKNNKKHKNKKNQKQERTRRKMFGYFILGLFQMNLLNLKYGTQFFIPISLRCNRVALYFCCLLGWQYVNGYIVCMCQSAILSRSNCPGWLPIQYDLCKLFTRSINSCFFFVASCSQRQAGKRNKIKSTQTPQGAIEQN